MKYQVLLGKYSEYLLSSTVELAKWLESLLPIIEKDNWWKICVLEKLSYHQRQIVEESDLNDLKDLDLSALLRIAEKNWYTLQQKYYLKQSERETLKNMFTVRNNWAHFSTDMPTQESINKDLETLIEFLSFLGTDESAVTDAKETLQLVRTKGIEELATAGIEKKEEPERVATPPSGVSNNKLVHLKSDPGVKGVVMGIKAIGTTKQYEVFINGEIKRFFEDQIEAEIQNKEPLLSGSDDIQRTITAWQINKPSSESLYSLNAARIEFVPYQFRPALKIIKSDTPRLLIADSVGVGKTIEAGLILKEMQARMPLDNVLIICPRPLVAERKWENEMKRFDEEFVSVDGNELRNIIKDANRDGEWPERYRRLILPYSLLTSDLLEGQKEKFKKATGLNELDPAPFFDLVIVDEAHHVRNSDTQAHKVVRYFCEHANAAVFLTATPVQMGNTDLFTLLNLLFPEVVIDEPTFEAMSEPNPHINSALRNLRIEGKEPDVLSSLDQAASTEWGHTFIAESPLYKKIKELLSDGGITREQRVKMISDVETLHSFSHMINRTRRQDIEDFCVRRVDTIESEFTPYQRELHDSLLQFEATVLRIMHGNMPVKFLMNMISRQASSCVFGLAPSMRAFVNKRLSDIIDESDSEEEFDLEGIDLGTIMSLAKGIIELAESLPPEDPKFDSLFQILMEKQRYDNNKIIIFSTFRHTLNYLQKRIAPLGLRVAQINGSVGDEERYQLRGRFELPKGDSAALDILLFSEVGSEGLDYQFCNTMINYDLPWNPMRVEQRIGRIDRRGQKSDVVHIYNCITNGTIDADIYNRCLKRIGVFEQSIGECSEILGEIATSIQRIVFDTTLTEPERANKLEQLANNEVRRMQEMQRLEDEQKQMFGLDVSSFVYDIEKAENPWIAPDALRNLVLGYLRKRLGSDKKYINDKRLTLTFAEKEELFKDFKALKGSPEDPWARFLRNNETSRKIVFEQDDAKDPKTIFITPLHPLVKQAAVSFANSDEVYAVLKVNSTVITPGEYPFLLYAWEYRGNRPQVEIVTICADENAQAELPNLIKNAVQAETRHEQYVADWEKLEEKHYEYWSEQRDTFREDARSICRFKLESLTRSVNSRMRAAQMRLDEATNPKIITMRKGEIERLDANFSEKRIKLEKTAEISDIQATKLVSGILIVEDQ